MIAKTNLHESRKEGNSLWQRLSAVHIILGLICDKIKSMMPSVYWFTNWVHWSDIDLGKMLHTLSKAFLISSWKGKMYNKSEYVY